MGECNGFFTRVGRRQALLVAAMVPWALFLASCTQPIQREGATPPPSPAEMPQAAVKSAGPSIQPKRVLNRRRAVAASNLSLRHDVPLRYVVKKGDTLWDIAGYYLRDPWEWPQLWYDNSQIKNPHLIYPGEVLTLVWVNGRPRVMPAMTTKRLEPQVRRLPLSRSTPSIPYSAIRAFIQGPRVVDAAQIDRAPYVVAIGNNNLVGSTGAAIFVKGLPPHAAHLWDVVHIGKVYRDPETGATLGYEAIPTGRCRLEKHGQIARMRIIRNDRETMVGDRLLPIAKHHFRSRFFPHSPKRMVNGSIISVFGELNEAGPLDIVTLDRGASDGLDPGTVLLAMSPARKVPDPYGGAESVVSLPPQRAGLLMVFKTAQHISYALVMKVKKPIEVLDRVVSPTSTE